MIQILIKFSLHRCVVLFGQAGNAFRLFLVLYRHRGVLNDSGSSSLISSTRPKFRVINDFVQNMPLAFEACADGLRTRHHYLGSSSCDSNARQPMSGATPPGHCSKPPGIIRYFIAMIVYFVSNFVPWFSQVDFIPVIPHPSLLKAVRVTYHIQENLIR